MSRFGILVAVLAARLLAPAAFSTTATGLRRKGTLYPPRPVCVEGEPCSTPAPGVLGRRGRQDGY